MTGGTRGNTKVASLHIVRNMNVRTNFFYDNLSSSYLSIKILLLTDQPILQCIDPCMELCLKMILKQILQVVIVHL